MFRSRIVSPLISGLIGLGLGLGLGGCGVPPDGTDANNNSSTPDAGWRCQPDSVDDDDDGDGITNLIEGCLSGRNTDGDQWPDWLDTDSDNDGCSDGDEDANGDGEVGDCRRECPNLDPDECGLGQRCLATRRCDPPTTWECVSAETDPLQADTNADGLADCTPLTILCEPKSLDNPLGRPPVQVHTSPSGKLQIAVWDQAVIRDQTIVNLDTEDCDNGADDDADGAVDCDDPDCHNTSTCSGASITFDLEDLTPLVPTAGFAISRRAQNITVGEERDMILEALRLQFVAANVNVRNSGVPTILLDQVESIVQITVDIDSPSGLQLTELRNQVITTLLHRAPDELSNLPVPSGFNAYQSVVSFTIQRRTPPTGEPYIAIMGAAIKRSDYDQWPGHEAQMVADAANGTGLALPSHTLAAECEELTTPIPRIQADIIWVIDDSLPAQLERAVLANGATLFFNKAIDNGLDFRMGVINMVEANDGILCTAQGQSNDFFLTPANLTQFEACILGPAGSLAPGGGMNNGLTQGYNAIVNHLPRAMAPNRIRPGASLVVIYFSVEAAQEVQISCGYSPPWDPACVQTEIQPTLNLLHGVSNPEAQGTAHAIVGPPPSGCATAGLGGGYVEIASSTGGQIVSVCQSDFSSAMNTILNDISYSSAYFQLQHRPISGTLTVAKDGFVQQRSSADGYTYHVVPNTLVFEPLQGVTTNSDLVIGYERWVAP